MVDVIWLGIECEWANPRINGEFHEPASPHSSGFVLCPSCGSFMDDLDVMVTENRLTRDKASCYVAGKRL